MLDVRGAGEFAESHVEGATNIAYTRLAARLDEVPDVQRIYVHCGSGLRAGFAMPYLAKQDREIIYVNGPFSEIPESIMNGRVPTLA